MNTTIVRIFLVCALIVTFFDLIECKGGRGGGSSGSRGGGGGFYRTGGGYGRGGGSVFPDWVLALIVVSAVGVVCFLIYAFLCC